MIADEITMARLMASSQKGDKQAYTVLLSEIQLWLERYFQRRCPPAQIDDLVQEVMLAVHNKRATYDPVRPFLPWLAAIARYRWIDHLRKVYRREEEAMGEREFSEDSEEEAVMARISLDRMFVQIPDRQAEVIEMVKIEGLSIREAASRSGQSESAVKVNIHRGLKKLSALIEKAE
ncbi:sigma-70 family RNA polymerase sigma factor [Altererythrobacter sp. MF3-039]|uniref:sigma-70 family RNA polymerase sigma factor n=1 Tax=Altererythrobacter sp. MF3-039 TaxID=3252901 RepID=UPI00390CCB5F